VVPRDHALYVVARDLVKSIKGSLTAGQAIDEEWTALTASVSADATPAASQPASGACPPVSKDADEMGHNSLSVPIQPPPKAKRKPSKPKPSKPKPPAGTKMPASLQQLDDAETMMRLSALTNQHHGFRTGMENYAQAAWGPAGIRASIEYFRTYPNIKGLIDEFNTGGEEFMRSIERRMFPKDVTGPTAAVEPVPTVAAQIHPRKFLIAVRELEQQQRITRMGLEGMDKTLSHFVNATENIELQMRFEDRKLSRAQIAKLVTAYESVNTWDLGASPSDEPRERATVNPVPAGDWVRITQTLPDTAGHAMPKRGTIGRLDGSGTLGKSTVRFEAADLGYSVPDPRDYTDRYISLYIDHGILEPHTGALPAHWAPQLDHDDEEDD
jgi:hypothetical protein